MAHDVNLTSQKWIDLIFDGKNKSYGAYTLRRSSPKRHLVAFLVVIAAAVIIVIASSVVTAINERIEKQRMTEVTQLSNIKLDKPEVPEENQIKKIEVPPVELKSSVQFTAPIIKKDEEVAEEKEMKAQDDLNKTDIAISTADIKGTNEETGVDISTLQEHKQIVQEEPKEEKVFDIVEQPPTFPGGDAAMYAYLSKNINYPPIAAENNIQGRVVCQFVVGRDGSIENVTVARGVDPSLDKEAIRLIKSMPKWIPGKQGGNAVKVKYTLPVLFKLNQ